MANEKKASIYTSEPIVENTQANPDNGRQEVSMEMEKLELKRDMGLPTALGVVIGSIVGTGIFISPKGVVKAAGSVGFTLSIWAFCGFYTLLEGLCFAELGTMIKKGGGHYTYLKMGVGNFWAFLNVAQGVLLSIPTIAVVVAQTFSSYTMSLLPMCGKSIYLQKAISATLMVSLYTINIYSSRLTTRTTNITTVAKMLALAVIIVAGLVKIAQGTTSELPSGFENTSTDPASFGLALFSAYFSYGGASNVNVLVEEIKNPARNIPLSIILGILAVTAVYTLTNVAYLAVMTPAEMIASDAVAVTFSDRALGSFSMFVPIAVMIATLGSLNNLLLAGSRLIFVAARDNNVPDFLSFLNVDQMTPLCSSTITIVLALLYLGLPGDSFEFINYNGFLGSLSTILLYVSFLRFRYTMKDVPRSIKVPLVIPIFLLLVNVYMLIAPIVLNFQIMYVYVMVGVLGCAILLYIPFVHFKWSPSFYDTLVMQIQLIFKVCPPAKFED